MSVAQYFPFKILFLIASTINLAKAGAYDITRRVRLEKKAARDNCGLSCIISPTSWIDTNSRKSANKMPLNDKHNTKFHKRDWREKKTELIPFWTLQLAISKRENEPWSDIIREKMNKTFIKLNLWLIISLTDSFTSFWRESTRKDLFGEPWQ